MDLDRFSKLAGGLQSGAVALAVVIGGGWTLYTFGAFHELDRRRAELRALERSLTERGIPDIVLSSEQTPGDRYHTRYLIVTTQITNRGNRTEAFNWATGGLLATRATVAQDGRQALGPALRADYMMAGGPPVSSTVLPGQTRRFPFLVGLDDPGLYHLQFSVQVSPLEQSVSMREHATVTPDTLIYTWAQTAYVYVR